MRSHIQFYPSNWEWRGTLQANKRPVEGVGINDVDYATTIQINGGRLYCPAYQSWKSMLRRCYNTGYHRTRPSYVGVTCQKPWLRFSNFRCWYFEHLETVRSLGYEGPLELDKDILSDSKTYGPKNCVLIPPALNNLLNDQANRRGGYSIGITKFQGKFRANVRVNGKQKGKAGFTTPEEAAKWRLQTKLKQVMNYSIPPWLDESIVRPRLIEIVKNQR